MALPTHVGMNRSVFERRIHARSAPHARGDEPAEWREREIREVSFAFPLLKKSGFIGEGVSIVHKGYGFDAGAGGETMEFGETGVIPG